ncbi:unnamed protein product [Didymodactylos carnosus]|uniref:Tc1-like transposase DDE domain-containing protein n=1 Tax=Didymodactylos carnosus TaxID=1234261 RepID=A0A8S2RS80_9BILA|nr:unnamed protein product [Didymodactylos carnosus]CAF4181606.1 unnamed protein product [Didymodactylos carnosus]
MNRHDESTFRSDEVDLRRWAIDASAPFFSKGRDINEWTQAIQQYPNLSEVRYEISESSDKYVLLNMYICVHVISDIASEKYSASASINIGDDLYTDNELMLQQFKHLLQLLQFKSDYKSHIIEVLIDNVGTHTSKEYSINDFGMKLTPDVPYNQLNIWIKQIHNKKLIVIIQMVQTKENHMDYLELIVLGCKLQQLKELISQHPAFKNVTKLEKLGMEYGIKVLYGPKYHCELNPIERYWCHMKQVVRKHNDQTFNKMVLLINYARQNFKDRQIYLKLCRRFWRTLMAYNGGKDYKEVLQMFCSSLCKTRLFLIKKL